MVTPVIDETSKDAFGKIIADATRNEIDLPSHFTFSPERLRVFRNGSREFVQYNTVSQFNDAADVWTLQPDADDTMHIETAESSTYVVNYALQGSFAFQTNQSLQSGDVIRVGTRSETDGWYLEQRGADHTDTQVDIIELSGGSTTTLESDADLAKPITDWMRYVNTYNWYGVGNQIWRQSYTENGDQINDNFAKTSTDGTRTAETGNINLWMEVEADANTSDLQMHVGSLGFIVLGDPVTVKRSKQQYVSLTASGTNDVWEPQYAIRLNPDQANVNAQFSQLDILDYAANDNIEMVVVSVDPSKTDIAEGDWGLPDYHHGQNTAIQDTTSVSEVPNRSGTQKDLTSGEFPGGFTIAASVDIDGGNASGSAQTISSNILEKKNVLASDHLVFLTKTGTTGSNLDFVWDVDQNW